MRMVAAVVGVVLVAGCGSTTPPAAPAAPSTPPAAPTTTARAACNLPQGPDYIERDVQPGQPASAIAVGGLDLVHCQPTPGTFAATAGRAVGECTTLALASNNPGYDVNAADAAPLRGVIARVGPGC